MVVSVVNTHKNDVIRQMGPVTLLSRCEVLKKSHPRPPQHPLAEMSRKLKLDDLLPSKIEK